jgi:formylglycine-generating enzyme required for sulfatase activity
MCLLRPAAIRRLSSALLLGAILAVRAQGADPGLQLRLAPTNDRVDLILEGQTNSGALFIYQAGDPRRLAPCPPVVMQTNTPLTSGMRFSLPASTRRFFQAAHWPGRPILDFTNQTMAYVPAGSFSMGDSFGEGLLQERPVHAVQVGGFWMDKHEVSLACWEEVRAWAVTNGYSFDFGAQAKAGNHPVHSVTWYDAVKWCNARSEKEGRVPAYYTDATLGPAAVYRSGQVAVANDGVNWAGGYRLPTEAEWEKAARGGATGLRFPCQDTLSHAEANYDSSAAFAYDLSPTRDYQPTYAILPQPYTSPVGAFAPSGHGLSDLAGNVQEWCWDLHDPGYYGRSPAMDPRGPATGSARVFRGGSWNELASRSRVGYRGYGPPGLVTNNLGFRTVLPGVTYAVPPVVLTQPSGVTNLAGSTVQVTAALAGTPPLSLQWRKDAAALLGATNPTLRLPGLGSPDAGAYDLVATNLYGSVTSGVAWLELAQPQTITSQPQDRSNEVGTVASFAVTATGTGPLSYQWRRGGSNLVDGGSVLGARRPTLTLSVSAGHGGAYDVVVRSPYGSATSAVAVLTVVTPALSGMVLIPAGPFAMGDSSARGPSDERPVHTVAVGAFYMDQTEVTKAQWDEVYGWAVTNGYRFDYATSGQSKAPTHPVGFMTWYDAVKWCNARSEKEGRVPAYYTNAALTGVYRTGRINLSNDWVRWTGGYRLPTEAEWEKAARGGVAGQRFGFGNTITHGQANYYSTTNYVYDVSPTRGYHPAYNDGVEPYTSPAGSFGANGYGLHDMAGNIWEFCWDWYDSGFYRSSPKTDPRGPATGLARVLRGGDYVSDARNVRSAHRSVLYPSAIPGDRGLNVGFRAVLSPGQP